jgi:hypothetical protein
LSGTVFDSALLRDMFDAGEMRGVSDEVIVE